MAYQAIGYDKRKGIMHVWDDQLGHQKFPFKPYGYLPNSNGAYQSLDGTRLDKVPGNHNHRCSRRTFGHRLFFYPGNIQGNRRDYGGYHSRRQPFQGCQYIQAG